MTTSEIVTFSVRLDRTSYDALARLAVLRGLQTAQLAREYVTAGMRGDLEPARLDHLRAAAEQLASRPERTG